MSHRGLLLCALTVGGTLLFISTANAQNANVNFTGVVQPFCRFDTTPASAGTLNPDAALRKLTSASAVTATVTCNKNANVSLGTLDPAGTNPSPTTSEVTVTNNRNSRGVNSEGSMGIPSGTTNLSATMTADVASQDTMLRAGNYNYTVRMTVTPTP
jgi:hypothetical protein